MYHTRLRNVMIFFLLVAFLALNGCPSMGSKSIQNMSPQERATWMLSVYNSQYRDYQAMTGKTFEIDPDTNSGKWVKTYSPELSDEQKTILLKRKETLAKVHPLIKMYENFVRSSEVPDQMVEDEIIQLLNSLLLL